MSTPSPTAKPGFFKVYLDLVKEKDLKEAFTNQSSLIKELLPAISEGKSMFTYADGKWTLKEMLQHLIDAERIFNYRALCFARKESAILPGFEENDYANASKANRRSWESLTEEFTAVRKATLLLFDSFSPEMLANQGIANNNTLTPEEIGFLIVGHFKHHSNIIKERYLNQ